ncbi:MAG TPA: hypothetical protein VLV83_13115, partial [Acidobacteriota bacterium]|nr:hypothetical protein [Acidobacteriota bacterium]
LSLVDEGVKYRKGDQVKILMVTEGADYLDAIPLYAGRIAETPVPARRRLPLTVRDITFDVVRDVEIGKKLTHAEFPDGPETFETEIAPIPLGEAVSVPCPLVDTVNHRHLAAVNRIFHVRRVYVYGVLQPPSAYTLETVSKADGEVQTFIRFSSPQIDPERPDEFAVTADIGGLVDENGQVPTDWASLIRVIFLQLTSLDASDLDSGAFDEAVASLQAAGLRGSMSVIQALSLEEVLARALGSGGLDLTVNEQGQIAVVRFSADDAMEPGNLEVSDSLILADSFNPAARPEEYTALTYNYRFRHLPQGGFFDRRPTQRDVSADEEGEIQAASQLNLFGVEDDHTALTRAMEELQKARPGKSRSSVQVALPQIVPLRRLLGKAATLNHWAHAVANDLVKITRVSMQPASMTATLELLSLGIDQSRVARWADPDLDSDWTALTPEQQEVNAAWADPQTNLLPDRSPGFTWSGG